MIEVDESLRSVRYEQTTMEALTQADFDLVCCSEVIEHVHD